MRSPFRKLVAASLLWLFLWPSPRSSQPPLIASQGTPKIEWTELAVRKQQTDAFFAWASHLPAPKPAVKQQRVSSEVVYGSGACGGDLPPCSVLRCESGGNLVAQNPRSTASGKWQILDSTWAGYGGYERAMYAPESVQDDKARAIYRNGAGRSAWVC